MQDLDIQISNDGQRLTLGLGEGEHLEIDASTLWTHCPSALRRSRRLAGLDTAAPSGISIARVAPIGNYAINIAFSDGHDRGIYPWVLLRKLARLPKLSDFLIADTSRPISDLPHTTSCSRTFT